MTARSEILRAIGVIVADRPDGLFTSAEVVATLRDWGCPYAESTIRTHVVSRMCVNAPAHHAVRYPDVERVDEGLYRLVRPAGRE